MRRLVRGTECDLRRVAWCFKFNSLSVAGRESARDALEMVALISARTSLSLLTVLAVSFDIDATVIPRESLSLVVRMEVAGDGEGRVLWSLIMRRDRTGGR